MPHTLEPASSGRAKCRVCGQKLAKGEIRLGERQPNPFGDGEMTLWFHPSCAAFKRPEVFLEVLETCDTSDIDSDWFTGGGRACGRSTPSSENQWCAKSPDWTGTLSPLQGNDCQRCLAGAVDLL